MTLQKFHDTAEPGEAKPSNRSQGRVGIVPRHPEERLVRGR
jgi:hypothetical protein